MIEESDRRERVVVRLAETIDAQSIAALNEEVQRIHAAAEPDLFKPPLAQPDAEEWARQTIGDRRFTVLLAELDGVAIGYLLAEAKTRAETMFTRAHRVSYIHHVAVRASSRRMRCGQLLVEGAIVAAVREGLHRIELDVWMFNADAVCFFEQQGFKVFNSKMFREV